MSGHSRENTSAGRHDRQLLEDVAHRNMQSIRLHIRLDLQEDDRNDICQTVWERFFRRLADRGVRWLTETGESVVLATLTRDACVDYLRKTGARKKLMDSVPFESSRRHAGSTGAPDRLAEKAEELGKVSAAIGLLDEVSRQVILLQTAWNLDDRRIAYVLGISEAAAGKRRRRAIEKLKDTLKSYSMGRVEKKDEM
ncbi:MAG: hypothetical protein JW909_04820 [Planctomycetes bacterium]|nr:hypothetical protein [Planctomycetota bacterium]